MKPLVLDTSILIEWLRGRRKELIPDARDRLLYLPAPVEMELLAGIKNLKHQRVLEALLGPFSRHNRIITPKREDFRRAGQVLAETGKSSSLHGNDALICVCARSIGAELWTLNKKDFTPFSQVLRLALGPE